MPDTYHTESGPIPHFPGSNPRSRASTTVAVFPLDTHLPSRLRRKMDEHCVTGNHVGSMGLVAAGGQGSDAPVVHAGACCRLSECLSRWSAWAGATQDRLDAGRGSG